MPTPSYIIRSLAWEYDAGRCAEIQPDREPTDFVEEEDSDEEVSGLASGGGKAVDFLNNLRGGSGTFYSDTLNSIWWYLCEQKDDDELLRCVPEAEADKDWDGNCIVPSDSPCTFDGFCESKDNCRWKKAEHGKVRETYYTPEEGEAATDYITATNMDGYNYSTGKYLVVAMALALLNIVFWFIFVLGRCCCCCLHSTCCCIKCSSKPKEEGYSVCYQVRTPIFFYLFFLACIVGASFTAFLGDKDMGTSLGDLFDHSREGLDDLKSFLEDASDPMEEISGLVGSAATSASTILSDNDYVRDDMDAVVKSLNDWGTIYSAELEKADAKGMFDEAALGLSDNVDPIVTEIQSTFDTLSEGLVEQQGSTQALIDDAVFEVNELKDTVDGFYEQIDDADKRTDDMKDLRTASVLAIFGVALVCIFFGFIGVISYWTTCKWDDFLIYLMNITWFLGSIIVTLSWILAGITIFISVLANDTCEFLNIIVEDFTPYVGSEASVGLNACFNNTPLIIAFNMTKNLDFQDTIDEQLAEMEKFDVAAAISNVSSPLADLSTEIKALVPDIIMPEFTEFMNIVDSDKSEYNTVDQASGKSLKDLCPFDMDFMSAANLAEMMNDPAILASTTYTGAGSSVIGGKTLASWVDINGNPIELNPDVPDVDSGAWFDRVMSVQGICTDPGQGCGGVTTLGDPCPSGNGCSFPCADIIAVMRTLYFETIPDTLDTQTKMLIDLGVEYQPTGTTACPEVLTWPAKATYGTGGAPGSRVYDCSTVTPEMANAGTTKSVEKGLDDYGAALATTLDEVLDIATGAIGDIMLEIEKFLCNMKCGFVRDVYTNVHDDLCSTLLGGLLQVSAGFWFLAVFMFLTCFLGAMLVVRMRGISTEEAEDYEEGVEMKAVNLDLYN